MVERGLNNISGVVVHCSVSDWGDASEIAKWHKRKGWDDIGYHFVIGNCYPSYDDFGRHTPNFGNDGKIEIGRKLGFVGAHCKGYNTHTIGVCLIGKEGFTGAQIISLLLLIYKLEEFLGRKLDVWGHYELNSHKSCPNISADMIRRDFETARNACELGFFDKNLINIDLGV